MDMEKIITNFSEIKHNNHFSKAKNAFLIFCDFADYSLSDYYLEQIKSLEGQTRKKYRKLKTLDFAEIDKKIKGIKNHKLKMCYQTILATGLRVAELSQIRVQDCAFYDDELFFSFIGKGAKPETVKIIKNEYPKLYGNLKESHATLSVKNKPMLKMFYSAVYLQAHAKKLGFACHDLRRVYAKLEYKKTKSINDVMQKLRHTSAKNTKIYLRSKIKV
jgi:integrase